MGSELAVKLSSHAASALLYVHANAVPDVDALASNWITTLGLSVLAGDTVKLAEG
jgi:hypothetical protein